MLARGQAARAARLAAGQQRYAHISYSYSTYSGPDSSSSTKAREATNQEMAQVHSLRAFNSLMQHWKRPHLIFPTSFFRNFRGKSNYLFLRTSIGFVCWLQLHKRAEALSNFSYFFLSEFPRKVHYYYASSLTKEGFHDYK